MMMEYLRRVSVQGKALDRLNIHQLLMKDRLKFTSFLPYGMHSFHKMPTVIDVTTPDLARTS